MDIELKTRLGLTETPVSEFEQFQGVVDIFLKGVHGQRTLVSDEKKWKSISFTKIETQAGASDIVPIDTFTFDINLGKSFDLGIELDKKYRQTSRRGTMNIVPPRLSLKLELYGRGNVGLLALNQSLVTSVMDEIKGANHIEILPSFFVRDPVLEQFVNELARELERDEPGTQLYVDSLAQILALRLVRQFSNLGKQALETDSGLPIQQLMKAEQYINDNLNRTINLAEVAAAANMNTFYFLKCFNKWKGKTPYQYFSDQRMERAKGLLLQGGFSVAEVAAAIGFKNTTNFVTAFRRYAGVTPLKFAKISRL